MIAITGTAGFIGSCLVSKFNNEGINDLVLADDFTKSAKEKNLAGKKFLQKIERKNFPQWLEENAKNVKCVIHIGARTDTTEFNKAIFDELNVNYSKALWNTCTKYGIPYIYASSAATYGLG